MDRWLSPVMVVECGPGMISISGEIDMSTAHQLYQLQDVHGPLLLDLHGVTFMDAVSPHWSGSTSDARTTTARS